MLKTKNVHLFFFVFIIMLALGVIIITTFAEKINPGIANAVSNETPKYQMTFDYVNSGVSGTSTSAHLTVKKTQSGANIFTSGGTASITIYGGSFNSTTSVLAKGGSINSNNIHISLQNPFSSAHYYIKDIINNTSVLEGDGNSIQTTLNDGSYSLTFSMTGPITVVNRGTCQYSARLTTEFVVDTTPPNIELSCNDGFSKEPVKVTYSDAVSGIQSAAYSKSTTSSFPASAVTPFSSGDTFTDKGNYTIKVTDSVGNSTTAYLTIDTVAPKLSLSGVDNGGFTNSNVSASWSTTVGGADAQRINSNDTLTVKYAHSTTSSFPTLANTDYTSGTVFSDEGNYLIVISDKAGNHSDYTFTIDKTPPKLTLFGANNGGFTNKDVTADWDLLSYGVGEQLANYNDALTTKYSRSTSSSFPTSASTAFYARFLSAKATKLTTEGNYLIVITDKAGNHSDYTFTIDTTAPTLSLSGVEDGGFTNGNVSASWSTTATGAGNQRTNNNDTLTVKYSRSTTSSFPTSATTTYTSGSALSTEGNYLIVISDKTGNSTSYTFTIDTTAPTFSLSGVEDGGFTNGNVSASWSTIVGGVKKQLTNNNDALTVKYRINTNENFPTNNVNTVYTQGTPLTAEGNYLIIISDAAGNTSSFVFTIDKTAPTLTLKTSDQSSFVNNRTAKDVSASWGTTIAGKGAQRTNVNDTLTVQYSRSTTASFPTSASTAYTSGDILNTEGKYLIVISDAAGNITEKQFEIYRQPPNFAVLSASGEELSQEPLAYNKNIKLSFAAGNTGRLNNKNYSSGTLISDEGEYSFVLTDELGNKNTATIYIIKTLPTANYDRLQSPINRWYETLDTDGTYSFASYDNAYSVADARERATIKGGAWTSSTWDGGVTIASEDLAIAKQGMGYYIYKSYDNETVLNAYFSIATLNKAIEKYVLSSIQTLYIPSTPSTAAEGEVVYRNNYFSKDAILFNRINNCTLYVDGVPQSYPYTLTEVGEHSIFEIDIAGNSVSYSVVVDTVQPIVRVTNLNGNLPSALLYGSTNYFTYGIRIYLDDVDEQAILRINDDYYLGGVVELREAGAYTISTRDAAGNSGSLTLYISLIEPTITISEQEVADVVNSFSILISKNYTLNNINSLSIYKFNEESGLWEALENDNSSFPVSINKNNLSYTFNVSGKYRVIVVDAFGRYLENGYTFVKGSPKGILSTSGGTILNSGDSTKSNVYFTWSNLLDCSAEISVNGSDYIQYVKGTILTSEGEYSIRIYSNVDSVSNIYEITIDKTAPFGVLTANGAEITNGSTTRHAVSLSWEENGCTATLNGAPYANGSAVAEDGDYTIELLDRAGNKRTYSFRIKTTPPSIILSTNMGRINNYDVTKYDVYVTWNERNCTCLVNGANYTQNSKLNIENSYTVVLTDAYGNTNSHFFTIDKTAPTGQLIIDDKQVDTSTEIHTNKKVRFTWTELGCSAVINNDFIYSNGSTISEDGTYTIKLSDTAGNISTYSFIIKTSAPSARLLTNGSEVSSGARTKYEARLTWTESGCTATVNGAPYSKGELIAAEGDYTFELLDSYGNRQNWTITIDKTAPVITLTSNGEFLSAGEITRFDVCYTWDDHRATATLNGIETEMGELVELEGEYTLVVTDDVGNKASIVFIIDKTAKVGTLISNSTILDTGSITRYSSYYTWNGSSYTVTLNGAPYSKGELITAEGDYRIELTDLAGNISETFFIIDKTAPTGELYFIQDETSFLSESGTATNGAVYLDWEESNCSATVNGAPYSKGELITAEGDYRIELTDLAGNTSFFVFTIDKTAPRAVARTASNTIIEDQTITKYSIFFEWSENSCTATVNGAPYSKGELITETGIYIFTLSDTVGNTTTITIEVYKVLPEAQIIPINNYVLPYLNDGFSIIWEEADCTAILNGVEYENGTIITAEGEYVFILTNKVGVETIEYITIDRTAPTINSYDENGNLLTSDVSLTYFYFDWEESNCKALLNDESYRAKTYVSKDGVYTLCLTDAAGNTSSCTVRLARTKPTISLIKEDSGIELSNGGSTTENVLIISTSDYSNIEIEVDGVIYNGEVLSDIGTHTIIVTDIYGNQAKYSFTIKEASSERHSNNPFSKLTNGSSIGTYLLIGIFAVLIILIIVVPLVKARKKNSFKNKLK